jgi:hypothetical protein
MRACLLAVLAALISPSIADAALAPAPNPLQGDGGVSPFYTWTGEIPDAPGWMLRTEALEPALGLAMAGQQFRILYSSTDGTDGKTPVAVSGAVFMPKEPRPRGAGR